MKRVGNFVLDTLQIYFPWDDDFYTFLKNKGFGSSGLGAKALPLIYTDNTKSTVGKKELRRKFVIRPELFGKKYLEVGWKKTERKAEPIIPAEKPLLNISLQKDLIIFKILPRVNKKEEYHLEYSSRSAFGKMYSNWVALYLPYDELKKLFLALKKELKIKKISSKGVQLKKETKQNKREEIDYVELPIKYYEFSLGEFYYAVRFLELNGYKGKVIPSLVFDPTEKKIRNVMEPIAKIGILHTTGKEGFMRREPQFVIKLSQNKTTISKRGKKAKVKGLLLYRNNENIFVLDSRTFFSALSKLIEKFKEKYKTIDMGSK